MKVFDFYSKNTQKCVIALGFFDAVHVGHKKVLTTCIDLSKKLDALPVAFTFSDSLVAVGKDINNLTTFDERLDIFSNLGIESVLTAPCSKEFFDLSPIEFLEKLKDDFNARGIVCGQDFTFGKFGAGNIDTLSDFCSKNSIDLRVVEVLNVDGKKIGARDIKSLIRQGKVSMANTLLGYDYFIEGDVKKGRGDGARYGIPTVNIDYPSEKVVPKSGVYATKVTVDGVIYNGITNVGSHPTFGDNSANIETFIIDFNENLYGKTIKVAFLEYVRDIVKFDTKEELKAQIEKDITFARRV